MPAEDLEDLYENAPCGYLSAAADGRIFRANATLAAWTGFTAGQLLRTKLGDLLTVGARIFYETHAAPALRLQGHASELFLELRMETGERLPVFANAVERTDPQGRRYTRLTISKAAERRRYERELIEARRETQDRLREELDTAALREQFIAVLGHDLRNPLTSIRAGMTLLQRRERLGPEGLRIVGLVNGSVDRMAAILDFARGRLGNGTALDLQRAVDLLPVLTQVVAEIEVSSPGHPVEACFALACPVDCDPSRIGQLLSNLLGNALTHGAPGAPVRLHAESGSGGEFVLQVANEGRPIPAVAMERLFQPFVRGEVRPHQEGLGLGLYIASEIAKAHGGSLTASSTEQETRFTLRMPIRQPA